MSLPPGAGHAPKDFATSSSGIYLRATKRQLSGKNLMGAWLDKQGPKRPRRCTDSTVATIGEDGRPDKTVRVQEQRGEPGECGAVPTDRAGDWSNRCARVPSAPWEPSWAPGPGTRACRGRDTAARTASEGGRAGTRACSPEIPRQEDGRARCAPGEGLPGIQWPSPVCTQAALRSDGAHGKGHPTTARPGRPLPRGVCPGRGGQCSERAAMGRRSWGRGHPAPVHRQAFRAPAKGRGEERTGHRQEGLPIAAWEMTAKQVPEGAS